MNDLHSNIAVRSAIAPAVQAASVNGNSIDRKGFESVTYIVSAGEAVAAGAFTAKVQHSDEATAGYVDVPAEYVIGNPATDLVANGAAKLGYVGHKRYSRVVLTKVSGTSIVAGAVAVLGHANSRPVA